MKKLLLLASLALTATMSAWAYDNPIGTELVYEVTPATGTLYNNKTNPPQTGQVWNYQWRSTTTTPQLIFGTNVNNIKNGGANLIFASGASKSCTYTFTAQNTNWYVSKIEFDLVSASNDGPRIVVGEDATMLTTTMTHYEREFAYDEDAVFSLNGVNAEVTASNFRVTVRKLDKENIADHIIKKYSFTEFGALWSVESANAVVDAICAKAEAHKDTETDVEAIDTELREFAEQQLREVLLPEANNKFVTFKDRNTQRYIAAFKEGETDGDTEIPADCSRMITNGEDMHAIWRITYDNEAKRIRFHHYVTDLDLGNNNLENTAIPVYDHSELSADAPGALFTLRPVRISTAGTTIYVVEMEDNTNANAYHFIHDNPEFEAPIKWNAAEVSPGSGWFVTVLDINPDGELAGLLDLKNKPVAVYDVEAGKYLAKVGENEIGFIDELRPAAVWNVNIEDEDHFENGEIVIKHLLTGKYANSLSGQLAATSTPSLKVYDYVEEHASWYIVPRTVTSAANVPENAHHYTVNEISAEQKAQMVAELLPNVRFELGDQPGLYTFGSEEADANYNALKEKVDAINGEEEFDYATADAIFNLETPAIYDLNALTAPALVRIKTAPVNTSTANAYINNTNQIVQKTTTYTGIGFDWETSAAEAESTIFVLHEGHLSSYVDGKYIVSDGISVPMMWEGTDAAENVGLTMNFVDATAKELGAYMLNYDHGINSQDHYLYCSQGVPDRSGFNTPAAAMAHSQGPNLCYNVEFVKQLTVEVDGYKLWRAPVTVNFGDYADNGAYIVEVVNNTITTTAAEPETNYGAGTVFLLTKTIIANCVNGDNTTAKVAGLGHHAVKAHTFMPEKVYLTVHEDQSPEQAVQPETQGLYFDNAETEKVRLLVKKVDEETTETLAAHTPVIEADTTENADLKDGDALMLPLGGSTETTEIFEIVAAQAANGIYDLQGRRLAAPVKGLNIINGKKTIIK